MGDDPASAAGFNLYATNGFAAQEVDGHRRLVSIQPPRELGTMAIDVSALVTLHRLDLLHAVASRLGALLIPATYAAYWIEEQAGIDPHQPTQIRAREAIVAAVDAGRLAVLSPDEMARENPVVLDEYADHAEEGRLVIRIRQIAALLSKGGLLDAPQLERVQRLSPSIPLASDQDVEAVLNARRIVVEVATLTTLHQIGVFDPFVEGQRLGITPAALAELRSGLASVRFCAEAAGWHRQLSEEVRADPRFELVSPPPQGGGQAEVATVVRYATDAVQVALARGVPLIVDDRFCQMLVHNGTRSASSAFGTDVLLARLAADGAIDSDRHASAWLQMVRWRYRFLVPSAGILLTLANRFRNALPGKALKDVAAYAHDCMADPGLFGGMEQVEPPLPIAFKLTVGWLDALAELCVDVWMDRRFTQEQAQAIVVWAVDECLPGPPCALPLSIQANIASGTTEIMTMSVLRRCLQLCAAPAALDNLRRAVSSFRRAIGFSDSQFSAVIASSIAAFADGEASEAHKPVIRNIILRMLSIAYGNEVMLDALLLPLAEQYGLVGELHGGHSLSDPVLEACRDPDSAYRLRTPPGPFVFVKADQGMNVQAIFMPELLLLPDASARKVAATHLSTMASPSAISLLSESSEALKGQSSAAWVPAGALVTDALEKDFVLHRAGIGQCRQVGFVDGQKRCWPAVIAPGIASLLSIDDDSYALLVDPDRAEPELRKLVENSASISELISGFERLLGHLPLAKPLDLATQLARYMALHGGANNVWDPLRNWACDTLRPWRRYHACQALLRMPSVIPSREAAWFWDSVCEILAFSYLRGGESLCGQAWLLHADLCRHYLRYLELYSPPMDPNRIVAVAWWAARDVAEMLLGGWRAVPAAMAEIRKLRGSLEQDCLVTSTAWQWLRPMLISGPGRETTLFQPSPWSTCILSELGDVIDGMPSSPTKEHCRCIWEACDACMVCSTVAAPSERGPIPWLWDRPLVDAVRKIVSKLPADLLPDGAAESTALFQKCTMPQAGSELLDSLPKTAAVASQSVASRLAALCRSSSEAADRLIEKLRDSAWRQACWSGLSEEALSYLGEAILDAQRRTIGNATNHLPHFLLEAAVANASIASRSALLVQLLVMASVAGSTVAALKLLLRRPEFPALRNTLLAVRAHLLDFRCHAPPVIRARLGHVLSVLSSI
ncbi:MAG: hypothetical protein ACE15C_21355 [Phycisphaerae bacterium]